jgi:hypothetical protein
MGSTVRASNRASIVRAGLFAMFLGSVGGAIALAQPAKVGPAKHLDALVALNKKFEGAGTCSGSSCHGGGDVKVPVTKIGSEFSIWQAKDAHAKAATAITKPDLKANPWMKEIAGKLSVPEKDLLSSASCVSCHGSPVPQKLQGAKFDQAEGVSCYQCHGPSETWAKPHATKGWVDGERAKMDHAKLLSTHGIFDTRPAVERAEMCASCHLAIDEKLVVAGHPQPVFEQLTFQSEEPEHWIDRNAGYARLNLYAAGQVVAMRETLAQLAMRPTDKAAFDQAAVHVRLVSLLVDAKAIPGDAAKAKALLADIEAAKGDAAKLTAASAAADALSPTLLDAIAKLPEAGDKATLKATIAALAAADPAAFTAHGRRGIEQLYFAVDRLTQAYRDGAKIAVADFKPVRDALKPARDLKLYDTRNTADAGTAATVVPAAIKDAAAKLAAMP